MKTKRIASLLVSLLLTAACTISVFAERTGDWPQFGGNPENPGVTSIALPEKEAEKAWTRLEPYTNGWGYEESGYGTPIIVENSLYVTLKSGRLLKLNAQTGEEEGNVECPHIPAYFSQLASDGTYIFVPQEYPDENAVRISAYRADTLALAWQSEALQYDTDPALCPMLASPLYINGDSLYFGTYIQDAATYAYTGGTLYSLDISDGSVKWKQDNASAGYYWNGPAAAEDALIAVDTAGAIQAFHKETGSLLNSVAPFGAAQCTSSVFIYGNRFYTMINDMTNTPGEAHIVSYGVTASGIDAASEQKSAALGTGFSSTPVVYDGKVYAASGGFGASEVFSILNADDLSVLHQIQGIHSQSTPLVCSAGEGGAVTIYVADYGESDASYAPMTGSSKVYAIVDKPGSEPESHVLFAPSAEESQFCSQSLIPGAGGLLYYWNDAGVLFALKEKEEVQDPPVSSSSSQEPSSSPSSSSDPESSSSAVVSSSASDSQPEKGSSSSGKTPSRDTASSKEEGSDLTSPKTGESGSALLLFAVSAGGCALVCAFALRRRK